MSHAIATSNQNELITDNGIFQEYLILGSLTASISKRPFDGHTFLLVNCAL